jgi:hypothetical protein
MSPTNDVLDSATSCLSGAVILDSLTAFADVDNFTLTSAYFCQNSATFSSTRRCCFIASTSVARTYRIASIGSIVRGKDASDVAHGRA